MAAKHGASAVQNSTSHHYRFEQYIARRDRGAARIYGAFIFSPGDDNGTFTFSRPICSRIPTGKRA
jgi:hypothetical protein